MDELQRITVDPHVMTGKPCIRGTRITVSTILGLMGGGYSSDQILRSYPDLAAEDIKACFQYAAYRLQAYEVPMLPAL